jgi:1-acyl-sn-glycerol-3-phosphate acyltransferase
MRRGRMTGRIVGVYGANELKNMDKNAINELIKRDLFEDAYAEQERLPVAYKGKKLAERLECALCICPACQRIGTLKSEGDRFFCTCGFEVKYNEFGYFTGDNVPFADVLAWDRWQDTEIARLCRENGSGEIFSDDDQSLVRIDSNHMEQPVAQGRLSLFRDRLKLGSFEAPISTIGEMAVFGRDNVTFSAGGLYYLVKSPYLRCGRRYVTAFENLKALR